MPVASVPSVKRDAASFHGSLSSARRESEIRSGRFSSFPCSILITCTSTSWPIDEDVLRVRGAAVADLADVQHPLDAAEVDEGAVGGQRRHPAGEHGADLELVAGLGGARLLLLLEELAARQHDVGAAAAAVPLLQPVDLEQELLADELLRVLDVAQVELRERAEGAHAEDLDLGAPLVEAGDQPLERQVVLVRLADLGDDLGRLLALAAAGAGGAAPGRRSRRRCRSPWPRAVSPSLTVRFPSASLSSAAAMRPSALPPRSRKTHSSPIDRTFPLTFWPTAGSSLFAGASCSNSARTWPKSCGFLVFLIVHFVSTLLGILAARAPLRTGLPGAAAPAGP